VQKTKISI